MPFSQTDIEGSVETPLLFLKHFCPSEVESEVAMIAYCAWLNGQPGSFGLIPST
jgi:hypothetical protein